MPHDDTLHLGKSSERSMWQTLLCSKNAAARLQIVKLHSLLALAVSYTPSVLPRILKWYSCQAEGLITSTCCLQLLKFSGCYHGHADSFLVQAGSGVATLGLPDSPGVPAASTGTLATLPCGGLCCLCVNSLARFAHLLGVLCASRFAHPALAVANTLLADCAVSSALV